MQKKTREGRKKSQRSTVKEVQFRPKIGKHDYDFKMRNAVRFLHAGDRVKMVVRFRGRENAHPEVGEELLLRAAKELAGISVIDQHPRREGRVMSLFLAPTAEVLQKARDNRAEAAAKDAAGKDKGERAEAEPEEIQMDGPEEVQIDKPENTEPAIEGEKEE
jgi:translation initiation factor IF-3